MLYLCSMLNDKQNKNQKTIVLTTKTNRNGRKKIKSSKSARARL